MNILIVVNLLEKKQPISYTIYRAARMLVTTKAVSQDLVLTDWQRIGSGSPGVELAGRSPGRRYDKHRRIILGFIVVCIVNMARYFSSLRALLVDCVTAIHCSINMLMEGAFLPTWPTQQTGASRLVYLCPTLSDHHDDEFIRRCERVRRQFIRPAHCVVWWWSV